ncbi:MAG TPA: glycerol kinase GlpK [Thermoanaerobaculia bacterium]
MRCVLALDQGTTSSRAILFDQAGGIVAMARRELPQIFPRPGWVEHDPEEIWRTQLEAAEEALARARIGPADLAAIGITNQRETTVVWERDTGRPIHHAIVWQDRRTADQCERLRADGLEEKIRERTGLVVDPYFSATKLAWILEHVPGARERAEAGRLAFGTVDSWLLWKLTGGGVHVTDVSNASRTMLLGLESLAWDEELLRVFRVPRSMLPDVRPSSEVYARAHAGVEFLRGVPVAAIAGDQQAALFGQLCLSPGLAKNTYGTGCFLLQNTGAAPVASRNRLLSTVAWTVGGRTAYALEGSVFVGGAVVQWIRDGLGLIRESHEIEALAASVPDSGGVFLVPAFAGLGAPHWDPYARGAIVGLTRGTRAAHIARAAIEAMAYQVSDLLDAVGADSGIPLHELRVDGGAAANDALLQFQSDLLGVPVVRPEVIETTALGAAYLAGLAVGFWQSPEALAVHAGAARRFEPAIGRPEAERRIARWREAVERAKRWVVPGSDQPG